MRSFVPLITLGLFLLPPVASSADQGKTYRLKEIFRFYDAYLRLPPAERTLFAMRYCSVRPGGAANAMTIGFTHQGRARTMTTDANGCFPAFDDVALLRANPVLTWPEGPPASGYGISLRIVPTARLTTAMSASDLRASVQQAARGARKSAGILGVAIPRFDSVYFRMPSPEASGVAVTTDGRRLPLTRQNNSLHFHALAPGMASVERVEFSEAPLRAIIGPSD
jgi:hypothetical protein